MDEIKKLEIKIPGMNIVVKKAIDQQIKQLKQLQPILGKAQLQKQILATAMTQDQKDYVFQQMGWL